MSYPLKTEAIRKFLLAKALPDLAKLYSFEMEVQVNVAQDEGDRVEGTYQGRNWRGWSDGVTTWKPFRIPFNANTEAQYSDSEIKFDLVQHAEGIGMTGWNWQQKKSLWVAFDFDAIVGHSDKHSKKLTDEELLKIREQLKEIEWVTIRRSTGGKGLHLYVFTVPVDTANHTEHAALARAILGKLSAMTGVDFKSKVDICGSNMWVWHRKMTEENQGLQLLKAGTVLKDIPPNWKDHIQVTRGRKKRSVPQFIEDLKTENQDAESLFEELTGQRTKVPLDKDHKKLFETLSQFGALWWWDPDHHMLVCHTHDLKEAHHALGLKGPFRTLAVGSEKGLDHNCYCFPLRQGAWAVRRYTPGVQEADTWDQDGQGWTRCFYNRAPDLTIAARMYNGLEHPQGGYDFRSAEDAIKAVKELGGNLEIPDFVKSRKTKVKPHKSDGKIIVEFDAESGNDDPSKLEGWINEKNKWKRVVPITMVQSEPESNVNMDDTVRHIISPMGDDSGWLIRSEGLWRTEPLVHVKTALSSLGYSPKEVTSILGGGVFKAWTLANIPFGPEYPGNREWNRDAAQLAFVPKLADKENLSYPTWIRLLDNISKSLNEAVLKDQWCKENAIFTGTEYLMCWIASLFQEPMEPLPYLFLYGDQGTGKSSLHEALAMLMTKGTIRADAALASQSNFNGELEQSVLCVIEETDLRKNKNAYNRIKDWVTSRSLLIHRKHAQPYTINNSTHWIQCSNDHLSCPIFPGDTRITVIHVNDLKDKMPRKEMEDLLRKEAPDFLAHILKIELPRVTDRLNIPVLITDEKLMVEEANMSLLQAFFREKCFHVAGELIRFSDFVDKFYEWLDPSMHGQWSKIRIAREIPPMYPKGRGNENVVYVGNLAFTQKEPQNYKWVLSDGRLMIQKLEPK